MNANRRQIRFRFPKGGFGVGDTFLFTSVCRYTDVTYEIPVDSFCATDIGSILQSVARVEYVHDPITYDPLTLDRASAIWVDSCRTIRCDGCLRIGYRGSGQDTQHSGHDPSHPLRHKDTSH